MLADLKEAQAVGKPFEVEKHVQPWPMKKHDCMLIPVRTFHFSGRNSIVPEISATPYIFTFQLWDWGRLGMDGKPRPINIEHGKKNIQWNRTTEWHRQNLVNIIKVVAEGDSWVEERTGLHEREFIETRCHWFMKKTEHHTNGGAHVICLVEGDEVIVESSVKAFEPFVVYYAEVFIVPPYWAHAAIYLDSELIVKSPEIYPHLRIESGKSIYQQFEENPDQFLFVPQPKMVKEVWENFVP